MLNIEKSKLHCAPSCKCVGVHYHILTFPEVYYYEMVLRVNPKAKTYAEYIKLKGWRQRQMFVPEKGYYARENWVDELDNMTQISIASALSCGNFYENRGFSKKELKDMKNLKVLGDI